MLITDSNFKCRICGCNVYRRSYADYECAECSVVFRNIDRFSLHRQLMIQYMPEYKLDEWGEINFAHLYDSGVDLRACIDEPVILYPYSGLYKYNCYKIIISTGIRIQPSHTDMDIKIYPRSGLGFKHGLRLSNSTGIIDNTYRGTIKCALINMGDHAYIINPGDKMVQMVIEKRLDVELVTVDDLDKTDRGVNGFGSTGTT